MNFPNFFKLPRLFLIGFLTGFQFIPSSLMAQELSKKTESDIRYEKSRWNEMRRRLEAGEDFKPTETLAEQIQKKTELAQTPPPLGPGINVVLPYQSGLSISGRKQVDFKLSSTLYDKEDIGRGKVNSNDFSLEQQLQVRVKGTVGRKVTVNVDFDDTRDDKRDISVNYKGDPDEIIQDISFGDISIGLPSTEFVAYSKSVFGMKAELLFRPRSGFARFFPYQTWHHYTPEQVKFYLIGSRTKGITETKRFTGQTLPQRVEINDINYQRRKFYMLALTTGGVQGVGEDRSIVPGSEKIFIDDQEPSNNNNDESTMTYIVPANTISLGTSSINVALSTSIAGPAGNNTGVFKRMLPGIDYSVDYIKGVIRFKRNLNSKDVIVADYIPYGSNQPISQTRSDSEKDPLSTRSPFDDLQGRKPFLIKPDESKFFAVREVKTYYDLGNQRIVRDDGRGNFILKVQDLNRNTPEQIEGQNAQGSRQTKPLPIYPQDIDVDFENGFFNFIISDQFHSPNNAFPDDIYTFTDNVPSFKNRYRVFVEYRFKKGNFTLDRVNIVPQSEQVFLDGRKMTRDVDYFIDYDIGLVSFFRADQIREDSTVEVTYDYSPFGGSGEETLAGMRTEIYITKKLFVGNSILLNFSSKPSGIPDIRSTAKSITVLEGDLNLKDVNFESVPLTIKEISGEIAQSVKNPNTSGKAIFESFEGIKIEDNANMHRDFWQIAANPQKGNPGNAGGAFNPGFADVINMSNQDGSILDVNPKATVDSSDKIQTLNLDYRFKTAGQNEAASIVHSLSDVGIDFFSNRRQFLELWIFGDNSNNKLLVRLGGVAELSDSGNSLRTEDTNNSGTLSPGEDVGWNFVNPDASVTNIGRDNGRLDTQDLNDNGRLDPDDNLGNFSNEIGNNNNPLIDIDGNQHTSIDWSGWKIFQIPLNITSQLEWTAIKNVRLTLANTVTGSQSGSIRFGRIAAVGTRFQEPVISPTTAPITAQVFAENNQENPNYPSLLNDSRYKDLYEITNEERKKRREQALAIRFKRTSQTTQISTITVKQTFNREFDLSDHKILKFFLYGQGDQSGSNFFIRIGNGNNYLQSKMPLNFNGWRLIELDIKDTNRDGKLDQNDPRGFGINWTSRSGDPSLRNINELTFGLEVPPGAADSSSNLVYVNEVYVEDSNKVKGYAWRARGDFDWKNWANWGASIRDIDRNFETLTSLGSGTDSQSVNGYFNFTRLSFLPINTSMNYSETVTPQIQTLNDPNILVPTLNEGKNTSTSQSVSGGLFMTRLPWIPKSIATNLINVDFSGDHSLNQRSTERREDEAWNYRYGSSYSMPWQPDVLPGDYFTFKPLPTSLSYGFSESRSATRLGSENTETESVSRTYNFRTALQLIPQLNLGMSYNFARAFEERKKFKPEGQDPINQSNLGKFNKNLSHSTNISGSLRIFSWLNPSFGYSINTTETNNVVVSSFGVISFKPGQIKSITRNSNADVNLSFAPKDILNYIPYVRIINKSIASLSFSGGYNLSDGDSYENVSDGFSTFNSLDKYFIRNRSLNISDPNNPNARRTSLTASDTMRLSGRWSPLEGFEQWMKSNYWAPLRNINLSGTFTESKTETDSTGTKSSSLNRVWPDFVFSTSELENVLFLRRWMKDSRLSGTYQERLNEVFGETRIKGVSMTSDFTFTLFKLLQLSLGYNNSVSEDFNLRTNQLTQRTTVRGINTQVVTTLTFGNWRVTPSYSQNQSQSEDGFGKKTSDIVRRNVAMQIFGDISVPRFFRMPLGKQLSLSNRLILTGNIRYDMTRDGVDDLNSIDVLDVNANGDLEVTPNIRIGFGGGYGRTFNKARPEDDFTTITFNSKITIQF